MKKNFAKRPLRVSLISLGCAKNLVDSEIMVGSLLKEGLEITNDAADADAVVVNTCSFIDAAQEESVDAILESAELRDARNRGQSLIVSGCLSQRFRDELPKLLPEVDAFMGIDQVAQAPEIVRQALARRAERLNERQTKSRGRKRGIVDRFAQIEKQRGSSSNHLNNPELEHSSDKAAVGNRIVGQAKPRSETAGPVVQVHQRPAFIPDFATPRFRLTPRHFAYVKIAEGCNHPCSFCTIPRMRGSHRSREQSDVIAEAKALIADGVKELNLISQDSTYYGLDLRANHSRAISSPEKFSKASGALPVGATTICTLLRELNALKGDFWIRLLYTHPAHWTNELIQTIAECPKVARYVDIPLQHIHENMLERMRRETSREYIVELLKRIRAGIPGIALRTTFIVGFPGETKACFESLLDFIGETRFERLGIFAYSQEQGTRAGSMAGQISAKEKQKRRDLAMAVQHAVAREVAGSYVGRTIKVLVEGGADEEQLSNAKVMSWEHGFLRENEAQTVKRGKQKYSVARGEADAPDIDGRVYVRSKPLVGEFATVEIVGHTDYDLIAELT